MLYSWSWGGRCYLMAAEDQMKNESAGKMKKAKKG